MNLSGRTGFVLAATMLFAATIWPAVPMASAQSRSTTLVYWDQNEEEDYFVDPTGPAGQLVPPYDPNGQMCIFPDGSGRFVTGYNPTLGGQHNPGSLLPLMNPPVGLAVWDREGKFTGKTVFVPGPFALPGSTVGGDVPPDQSNGDTYNDNGTYTGCAFDRSGHLFAVDIGQGQGSIPPPDSGRLIEWFPPDYTTSCVLIGPTQGGVGAHHVDGSGGLRDPGTLAVDDAGDVYVPESGALDAGGAFAHGRVLRVPVSSIPSDVAHCGADGRLDPPATFEVFIQGTPTRQPFPLGVARDPQCRCWAVSSVIGSPAIAWYDDNGSPDQAKGPIVGDGSFNPFGLAFTSTGDLFFVDIHLSSTEGGGYGPSGATGRVFKVTFQDGAPSAPKVIADKLPFPVSVTTCDPARRVCPAPEAATPSPTASTPAPTTTPSPTARVLAATLPATGIDVLRKLLLGTALLAAGLALVALGGTSRPRPLAR